MDRAQTAAAGQVVTSPRVRASLSGVSLRRAGQVLLDDVDLTVSEGERWIVLGANGSGKTSLLQLLSTYEQPSRGDVEVLGERLGTVDVRRLRKRIGYASSAVEEMIPPRTTLGELVMTGKHATLRVWSDHYDAADRRRAEGLLAQLGLEGYADRRFDTLSQGERRRAQVARSLMGSPELLLLDEPTAGLDLGGREDLVQRLAELVDTGPDAIVFVTHHVEEIPPGFSHVALLRSGRLVEAGPIDAVLTARTLSACFDTPLTLERRGSRFTAWQG